MEDSHVGVISRVISTMVSNTSLIVALSSLKLSAPAMAAEEYDFKAPRAAPLLPRRDSSKMNSLEGTSILTPGKQVMLGSLDVPGSTRHLELGVVVEVVL